ncbi:MAG: xanthine dehydrogenase family protein molybdopterin-binding subunit [Candidatus Omnitrophica bacterium]|nr:xanthine dehydrogenase family protein molybdopterin-binding subunit [Candidatus Omnitrophota bacterium]
MVKNISALIGHDDVTKLVQFDVPDGEPGFWDKQYKFVVAGEKPVRRLDGMEKVTGKAKYTYDIYRPNQLCAELVLCPHAHARIVGVDASKAEKMPGVRGVMLAENLDAAMFAGWIIAMVAADTIQQARDAARSVLVEYDAQDFVVLEDDAGKDDNPIRKPSSGNPSIKGDVEKGFQEAFAVHEAEYVTQTTPHNCLETHGCVAEFKNGELTVWFSTQSLWSMQQAVAGYGGMPLNKTRVITEYMGGGFGSKLFGEQFADMCVKMAKKIGRPIKFMANRYFDSVACGNKPAAKMHVKIGAQKDGAFTAIRADCLNYPGFSGGASVATPFRSHYECPNIYTQETNVYTNTGLSRPFRAPGRPQGSFGLEMAIEELCMKMGLDPYEVKIKNVDVSPLDPRKYQFEVGAERFGWKKKFKKHGSDAGPVKTGVGCAVTYWGYSGDPGGAVCRCTLFMDGSAEVAIGCQDLGTGFRTMAACTAAETLGIDVQRIQVLTGDTDIGLVGPLSGGSKTTPTVAPAIKSACYKAQQKLFGRIAGDWDAKPEDIVCRENAVFNKENPEQKMPWNEAAQKVGSNMIVALGEHIPPPDVEGIRIGTGLRGAQFAQVEVNVETGKISCKKVVAVQDCGRAMAKAQAESQICGGVIQGVSYALFEDRIMDSVLGRQLNPQMEHYKILNAMEAPDIEPILIDVFDPVNCASAKGIGEPPHVPTAAAVACAVCNAIGKPIRSLPITPYKVLEALYGERR